MLHAARLNGVELTAKMIAGFQTHDVLVVAPTFVPGRNEKSGRAGEHPAEQVLLVSIHDVPVQVQTPLPLQPAVVELLAVVELPVVVLDPVVELAVVVLLPVPVVVEVDDVELVVVVGFEQSTGLTVIVSGQVIESL